MSYVVLLLAAGVTIYALVDCWSSTEDEVRGLPRLAWLLVILLFPLVGGIAYLLSGRERFDKPRPYRSRVIAPDDDPEFLRQLDQQRRLAAAEERRRVAAEERRRVAAEERRRVAAEKRRHEQQLRKNRERPEHQHRQGDHDGEDHSGHPTSG